MLIEFNRFFFSYFTCVSKPHLCVHSRHWERQGAKFPLDVYFSDSVFLFCVLHWSSWSFIYYDYKMCGISWYAQSWDCRGVGNYPSYYCQIGNVSVTLCFSSSRCCINPLNPELNPICYLLALLGAHHFLHVRSIRVKLLTFRLLMSYIYGAPILDVSRSHTTTQHSR